MMWRMHSGKNRQDVCRAPGWSDLAHTSRQKPSGSMRHPVIRSHNQQLVIDNYCVRAASSSERSTATPAPGAPAAAGIVASVGTSSSGRGGAASLRSLKLR